MPKLFQLTLGGRIPGRNTEQHDVFVCLAHQLDDLISQIKDFWTEMKGKMHCDIIREVRQVSNGNVKIIERTEETSSESIQKLYFVNFGAYSPDLNSEIHHVDMLFAENEVEAKAIAKKMAFYKKYQGAGKSHVDDLKSCDIDDLFLVKNLFSDEVNARYAIHYEAIDSPCEDLVYKGFYPLKDLEALHLF